MTIGRRSQADVHARQVRAADRTGLVAEDQCLLGADAKG
jgi:hypothetical protein